MKKTIVFFIGLIAGSGVAFLVWGVPLHRQVANQYLLSVMDQAFIGIQLNEDHQAAVTENIGRSLPEYVAQIGAQYDLASNDLAVSALWMVRLFYERQHLSPPVDIQPVLYNLPSDVPAICQKRLDNIEAWSNALEKQSELVISLPEADGEQAPAQPADPSLP